MLAQGQLTNTLTAIYAVSGSSAQIKTLLFFNNSDSSNTVSIHLVPNNGGSLGTAGATNQVIKVTLPPSDTFEFSPAYPIVYSSLNDSIQASATNSSQVNYFVMGVEN